MLPPHPLPLVERVFRQPRVQFPTNIIQILTVWTKNPGWRWFTCVLEFQFIPCPHFGSFRVVVWAQLLTFCHFLFFNLSLVVSFYGWSSCLKTEKLQKNTFIKNNVKILATMRNHVYVTFQEKAKTNKQTKRKKEVSKRKNLKKIQCLKTRYILWNTIFDLLTIPVMTALGPCVQNFLRLNPPTYDSFQPTATLSWAMSCSLNTEG